MTNGTGDVIGGGRSRGVYTALFALGVLVGSGVRLALWVLPSDLVDAVVDRIV